MNEEFQETNQGGRPQVVKYVSITGPIGTYIEHVDKLYLSGNVDNTPKHQIPTPEQMCKIVEKMMEDGLWYAGREWAVVYRLYQGQTRSPERPAHGGECRLYKAERQINLKMAAQANFSTRCAKGHGHRQSVGTQPQGQQKYFKI